MSRGLLQTRAGRVVAFVSVVLVAAVVVGMVALWPDGEARLGAGTAASAPEHADVVAVTSAACSMSSSGRPCQRLTLELTSGRDRGERVPLTMPGTDAAPKFAVGDRIEVFANGAGAPEPYAFSDFERGTPITLLALLFGALVVVLGRWKGVLSLIGLGLSLIVVLRFIVPAILDGSPPLLVALVGGMAVMLATLALTYGIGPTSLAAALGAAGALVVIAVLAVVVVQAAHLTGFSSEESTLLLASEGDGRVSLEGLVLAGIIIAALGVLDDVCVSQASTVVALRRANPALPFARLFGEAMQVGRDHLSATVNTLVFAYVGASLPALLIFQTQGTSIGDAVGRESVAEEVAGMLVGSVGLILAVPVTTALAALLARLLPTSALEAEGHAHHHH